MALLIDKKDVPQFVRVVDGLKSHAGNYVFRVNEINEADNWNPQGTTAQSMGGFNFSTEDKILRWIHRGDTLYDVSIPMGADVIDCSRDYNPKSVYRTNKIILTNPRKITNEMIMDLYHKSTLPDNVLFQCLAVFSYRGYLNAAIQIIDEKINKSNIDACLMEFRQTIARRNDGAMGNFDEKNLWTEAKIIYSLLQNIKYN